MNKETKRNLANFNAWYRSKSYWIPPKVSVDRLVDLKRRKEWLEDQLEGVQIETDAIDAYNLSKSCYMQAIADSTLKNDWTKK